jgi:hypothetical protein
MQQGMLFHTLFDLESAIYFRQISCVIEGELDLDAFKQAWQQVIDRHAALRTFFVWKGLKEPVQVVRESVSLPWAEHDWQRQTAAEKEAACQSLLQAERKKGITLDDPPLLRLSIARLDHNTYYFVWSYHHLLVDGWSLPLILKEALTFYTLNTSNDEAHLPPAGSYHDYIAWLRDQDLSLAQKAWQKLLQGFKQPTPLPQRIPAQATNQEIDYAERRMSLPGEVVSSLTRLARQHRFTLSTPLQGAWALLLSYYSGDEDVVFGVTVAGRPAKVPDIETTVGLFINTLPLRVYIHPEAQLVPWLKELQTQQVSTRQYEYTPLAQIQKWSEVPSNRPLFETILNIENYPVDRSLHQLESDFRIRNVHVMEQSNYPIGMQITPEGTTLTMRIGFDANQFSAEIVNDLMTYFALLLEAMTKKTEATLAELKGVVVAADNEKQSKRQQKNRQAGFQKLRKARRQTIRGLPAQEED